MPFSITANNTVDINGGTIDGTNIGASSAGTGAFTTLSASGALTGTLGTAAQPNITSLGALTALVGGTGDLNWDSNTFFVDSSSNQVGIGTNDFNNMGLSSYKGIKIGGATLQDSGGGNGSATHFLNNAYVGSGNNFYFDGGGAASGMQLTGGDVNFFTFDGSGGSADAQWSTVSRLHVAQNGRIGINTTDPDAMLEIVSSDPRLRLRDDTTGGGADNGGQIEFVGYHAGASDGKREFARIKGLKENGTGGDTKGYLSFLTNGGSLSEAARLDSSGNLLIGKTSTAVDPDNGVHIKSDGTVFSNISSSTTGYQLRHNYNNRFFVTHLGVINAQTTSISGISDERLKENIKDLETGLNEVLALKPRRFDWVEDEKVPTKNIAGFIAQEVETVLPDLIGSYEHDRIDNAKSLKMGDMIPTLVKAIQEQQTIIEDLKARITTLEG